ncbi:hypothetical protein [Terrimonas alba]|uniref:hypothetical protein n=1 Tax=Terrimonas alba TaxID=3349636 RepID=UPI0035F4C7C6
MRKYLIALVAVVAVVVVFAFTPATGNKDKKAVLTTYYYTGDDSYSQQTNETFYIKNPGTIPNCPDQGQLFVRL